MPTCIRLTEDRKMVVGEIQLWDQRVGEMDVGEMGGH